MEVQQRLRSPWLETLTALGLAAARRLHQYTHPAAAQQADFPGQRRHTDNHQAHLKSR
jgi:hypothetical protein